MPDDEEQEWLLGALAGIVRARGADHFLRAPIVEPTPEYFPDRISSPAEGLDRVTRRLMQYAGLGQLDVRIGSFAGGELEGADATDCWRIAGCFFGIVDGCCRFGINVELPPDIEQLAGVMAHEVAHAYRAHHRLVADDRDDEELLTDVTTAYLGFGVLSVNNSYRFRKSGYMSGREAFTEWSTSTLGYLSPQAHSFLLASQIVARELEPARRKAICRRLESNQAAFVEASVKLLLGEEAAVSKALRLPATRCLPPRPLEEILLPLEPFVHESSSEEAAEPASWNSGKPVFRIARSNMVPICIFDTLALGTVGLLLSQLMAANWLGAVAGATIGLGWGIRRGRRTRREECSDSDCQTTLVAGSQRCPKCGGEIMGLLRHPDDRLEMEEKLRGEARKRARAGSVGRP